MHGQGGSIHKHLETHHNIKPTRQQLTGNTTIIAKDNNRYRLLIKESLLISKHSPSINKQFDNFTHILKLHSNRTTNSQNSPNPTHLRDTQHPNNTDNSPSAPPLSQIDSTSTHSILSPSVTSQDETFSISNTHPSAPLIPQIELITNNELHPLQNQELHNESESLRIGLHLEQNIENPPRRSNRRRR